MHAANVEILVSNSMGDDAFVREIVAMTVEQIGQQIDALRALCDNGTFADWRAAAHALKGSAATLGAEEMRVLCAYAQTDMEHSTPQERRDIIPAIESKFALARESLIAQGYLTAG